MVAVLPPYFVHRLNGKHHISDDSDEGPGGGSHLPTVLIFYYLSLHPFLPPTLPPPITTLIQSHNGYPPSAPLPPMLISLIRLTTSLSPMTMLLMISHSTNPPISMMTILTTILTTILYHPQSRRILHLTTPFPSSVQISNILLPLPWTSARYIPKMPMDSGVEHVTEMATSSIIVNVTQPNLNI